MDKIIFEIQSVVDHVIQEYKETIEPWKYDDPSFIEYVKSNYEDLVLGGGKTELSVLYQRCNKRYKGRTGRLKKFPFFMYWLFLKIDEEKEVIEYLQNELFIHQKSKTRKIQKPIWDKAYRVLRKLDEHDSDSISQFPEFNYPEKYFERNQLRRVIEKQLWEMRNDLIHSRSRKEILKYLKTSFPNYEEITKLVKDTKTKLDLAARQWRSIYLKYFNLNDIWVDLEYKNLGVLKLKFRHTSKEKQRKMIRLAQTAKVDFFAEILNLIYEWNIINEERSNLPCSKTNKNKILGILFTEPVKMGWEQKPRIIRDLIESQDRMLTQRELSRKRSKTLLELTPYLTTLEEEGVISWDKKEKKIYLVRK